MNAQQQDIIRLLTARGPMTSRELFDVMQDELGYYGFAANHDQIQRAVESLSKILSKMKAENLINGSMTAQPKGRPVMVWSEPKGDGYIAGVDEIPDDENPDDEHAEMESDITELQSMDDDSRAIEYMKELDGGLQVLNTASVIRSSNGIEIITMKIYASDSCYLNGEAVIRNRAELAQFIGAIERMLP